MSNFKFFKKSLRAFIIFNNADWGMVCKWMEDMCGPLSEKQWAKVAKVYRKTQHN